MRVLSVTDKGHAKMVYVCAMDNIAVPVVTRGDVSLIATLQVGIVMTARVNVRRDTLDQHVRK